MFVSRFLQKLLPASVYTAIFFLPIQTRWIIEHGKLNGDPWEYGTVSLYATDILIILALIFWLAERMHRTHHAPPKKYITPFILVIILLATIALFSLTFADNTNIAGFALLKLLEGIALVPLLANKKIKLETCLWVIFASGVLQSLFAYGQFMAQYIPSSKWLGLSAHSPLVPGDIVIETVRSRLLRAYGSFPHPNMLGSFLLIALFAGAALALSEHHIKRVIAHIGSISITFGILWTFSRSTWLALGAGLIILAASALHNIKNRSVWMWIGLITLTLFIQIVAAPELFFSRWQGQARLEQKSLEDRKLGFTQARTLLADDAWILGRGAGNYTHAVHEVIDDSQPGWWYQPVHNVPFLVFVELGIFGFITFLLLAGTVISVAAKHLTHSRNHSGGEHERFMIMNIIALTPLVIGLFDHFFWTLHSGILMFWIALALWHKKWKDLQE